MNKKTVKKKHFWQSLTLIKFTLKLGAFYMFRSTTIIRELAIASFLLGSLHQQLGQSRSSFINRCTFIKTLIKFTLKLGASYMFRSTTIIRELAIEPG